MSELKTVSKCKKSELNSESLEQQLSELYWMREFDKFFGSKKPSIISLDSKVINNCKKEQLKGRK